MNGLTKKIEYSNLKFSFAVSRRRVRSRSRMKRCFWFAAVLWASLLGCVSSSSLDPSEQAQVSITLDSAQFVINEIAEENKAATKALKDALKISDDAKSAELLIKQTKLTKFAFKVGKALKAVQAASAIASIVFIFFMPSKLDVITGVTNERFKK